MNVLSVFAITLLAAPLESPTEASDVVSAEATLENDNADPLGPYAVGLVLGEPTALRADYYLDEQTRAFGLLGMAHRIDAFSFAFDAPMLGVGAERDVLMLDTMGIRSGAIAVGVQADLWIRSFYTSSQPLLALEIPVSFRLASPSEPLSFYATFAPSYYVSPGAGPGISISAGVSFRLPSSGASKPARPEFEDPALEGDKAIDAASEIQAEPEPKPEPEPEPKPKRKGRRRLSR
tara:strand:+ start:1299 stop:2003 length:705 start_codon:yes stop_codon:yes gene_type:complete